MKLTISPYVSTSPMKLLQASMVLVSVIMSTVRCTIVSASCSSGSIATYPQYSQTLAESPKAICLHRLQPSLVGLVDRSVCRAHKQLAKSSNQQREPLETRDVQQIPNSISFKYILKRHAKFATKITDLAKRKWTKEGGDSAEP